MEHVKKREEISKEFTWALEDLYQWGCSSLTESVT